MTIIDKVIQIIDLISCTYIIQDESFSRNLLIERLRDGWVDGNNASKVHRAIDIWDTHKDLELELIETNGGFEEGTGDGDLYFNVWKTELDGEEVYFRKQGLYYSHIGVEDWKPCQRVFPKFYTETDYLIKQ